MIIILQHKLSIAKSACLALCVGLGFSFGSQADTRVNYFPNTEDKPGRLADADKLDGNDVRADGLQQTLNLNFSPEHREKLRKALEEYARSVDPSHDQIEERRRAMQQSIEARFFEADTNNDGTLDRQEATEKLPQIARHFNSVDINQDSVISLAELDEAQARILERRRKAEAALQAQTQQKLMEAEELPTSKPKNKQATNKSRKNTL